MKFWYVLLHEGKTVKYENTETFKLENIMLNEITKPKKDKYYNFTYMRYAGESNS